MMRLRSVEKGGLTDNIVYGGVVLKIRATSYDIVPKVDHQNSVVPFLKKIVCGRSKDMIYVLSKTFIYQFLENIILDVSPVGTDFK